MTAHPQPTQHPSLQRTPVLAAALRTLTTHTESAVRRRDRLQRYDAAQVQQALAYIEWLENTLRAERTRRVEFEANAEGEFAELRLQVRAWQTYAAQMEERRDVLKARLAIVVAWVAEPVRHWWQAVARERRAGDHRLHLEARYGRLLCADPEPTAPAVELP